jgi:CheY-like chemotaxis protein
MLPAGMPNSRILVVDDEEDIRDVARLLLESEGYSVVCVEDGRSAIREVDKQNFDLVITDMLMPEMDGVELINELRRRDPGQPIMAISGGGHAPKESYLQIAHLCGAQVLLAKPFNRDQLVRAVRASGVLPA